MGIFNIIVGILALLGALVVLGAVCGSVKAAEEKKVAAENAAAPVSGMLAQLSDAFSTPLTNLPMMPGGCTAVTSAPMDPNAAAARNELYPGSYVNFGLYNTGCYDDPRNKRC